MRMRLVPRLAIFLVALGYVSQAVAQEHDAALPDAPTATTTPSTRRPQKAFDFKLLVRHSKVFPDLATNAEHLTVKQNLRITAAHAYEDVRHIVLTHLHIDHTGGLPDFPNARVHVHAREYAAAMRAAGLLKGFEYVPAHWRHSPRWELHSETRGQWFGFDCIRVLAGLSEEILLIPLMGHTPGHCGVAVKASSKWLFLIGDEAYPFYSPQWMNAYGRPPSWVLRVAGVGHHMARLQALWRDHADEVDLIFSHDHIKFAALQGGTV